MVWGYLHRQVYMLVKHEHAILSTHSIMQYTPSSKPLWLLKIYPAKHIFRNTSVCKVWVTRNIPLTGLPLERASIFRNGKLYPSILSRPKEKIKKLLKKCNFKPLKTSFVISRTALKYRKNSRFIKIRYKHISWKGKNWNIAPVDWNPLQQPWL